MTVMVDTPILIDHLRGDLRAMRYLTELFDHDGRVWAATPTRTEVIAGIREGEEAAMTELFAILTWVEIDVAVADAAGEFGRQFSRSHSGIDTVDYLIAAAAMSVGARLITLNVRHFPMFKGLEPAYL